MFRQATIYLSFILILERYCIGSNIEVSRKSFKLQPRIHNGTFTGHGQFPYQASIRKLKQIGDGSIQSQHYCGGSLISNVWILTAAHCLANTILEANADQSISADIVVVGAYHLFNDGIWYEIARVVAYPEGSTAGNDIGLLQTRKSIEFNTLVKPIAMNDRSIPENSLAVVSGWGNDRVRFQVCFQISNYCRFTMLFVLIVKHVRFLIRSRVH